MGFFMLYMYTKKVLQLLFFTIGIILYASCRKKDTVGPVITLTGENNIRLALNTPWNEPGYQATDDEDGDVTSEVSVSGIPNSNLAGVHTITYSVSDNSGNTAEITRTVTFYNEADFLKGIFYADDTCQQSFIPAYIAILTPSITTNKKFSIKNFRGLEPICNCNVVVHLNVADTTANSVISWNAHSFPGNDTLIASSNGGIITNTSPVGFSLIYQWFNGTSTETCTGIYIKQ